MLAGSVEIILIIAILLVLALVVILFLRNKKLKATQTPQKEAIVSEAVRETVITADSDTDNDELVAAFLALHLYTSEEIHDEESNVLTIERTQRRYSPWSSKIYSINNILQR